jgi:hypothetical protein
VPSVSANEDALTGILEPARAIPAPRPQKTPEELEAEWQQPQRVAARKARIEFALDRLASAEQQQDFTPLDAACRLLPFLLSLWWAESDADHPRDRRAGCLPYPPPRYTKDHPLYCVELDE